ncbi:MAG: hypothetical protein ABSC56_05055 [Solirubrobacteraceae bacterium]
MRVLHGAALSPHARGEHEPLLQDDLPRFHAEIARRAGRIVDLASGEEVTLEGLGAQPTDLLILP